MKRAVARTSASSVLSLVAWLQGLGWCYTQPCTRSSPSSPQLRPHCLRPRSGMEGDLDGVDDSPPESQVNYQDSVDLFDSVTGGASRKMMPSIRPSLTSRTRTSMLLIWLPPWRRMATALRLARNSLRRCGPKPQPHRPPPWTEPRQRSCPRRKPVWEEVHFTNIYAASLIRQDKSRRPFGFCVGIGAPYSVISKKQLNRILAASGTHSRTITKSYRRVRFDDTTFESIGRAKIPLWTPPSAPTTVIDLDIVVADVSRSSGHGCP